MHLLLLLSTLATAQAQEPISERLFLCSFGARSVQIVRDGALLTYVYGPPDRPELVLTADAASGTLFYHRTLYVRGQEQSLRFTNGSYAYLVYNAWSAPDHSERGARDDSGLLVLHHGRVIRRLRCREGGDFPERPIFRTLPRDAENRVPGS